MKPYYRKYSLCLILFFLGFTTCGFAGSQGNRMLTQENPREEAKMSQISEAVRALDLTAAKAKARVQGAAAVPELLELLQDEDNGVRSDAVFVLGEIDHPDAFTALMQAAEEDDNFVAAAAVAQLSKYGNRIGADQFVKLLRTMKSDPARGQLIKTIGQIGNERDREGLRAFCAKNTGEETALSCMAALARMGDEKARQDFGTYLVHAKDLKAFALSEYIGQRWLLPHLGELLRSPDPVQYLGDMPPKFPKMLRVCDKAVVLIAQISGERLSFPTNVHRNYDNEQLAEAAKVANSPQ